MATLVRWDPFAEMTSLREMMDRLFEQAWVRPSSLIEGTVGRFPIDLYETADEYVLEAALPGVRPDEVSLTIKDSTVTITCERKREEGERVTWLARELPAGRFTRQVILPSDISVEEVEAHMEHGLLRLRLPKVAAARERRIPIHVGGTSPQIAEAKQAA